MTHWPHSHCHTLLGLPFISCFTFIIVLNKHEDEANDKGNNPSPAKPPIILAELYQAGSELHKDAVFLDYLGVLLSNADTTIRFRPHLNNFKKSYITARRSIEKGIQRLQEGIGAVETDAD